MSIADPLTSDDRLELEEGTVPPESTPATSGDVCVTVPMKLWAEWLWEGQLPDESHNGDTYHFWLQRPLPEMQPGDRVYIVAYGRLRGYAPLVAIEQRCNLRPSVGCLVRQGGAVAVTTDQPIRGFRGWRYRDWDRAEERPFPEWRTENVPAEIAARIAEEIGVPR